MELWQHQRLAVEKAGAENSLALFFDVGTGKTRTMIEILRADYNARKKVCNTLILAPISVCPQWKRQFELFSKIPQDMIHVLVGEAGQKRAARLRDVMKQGRGALVVTNYEALRIEQMRHALYAFQPEVIIADESHGLKDAASQRNKALFPLAEKARRRFLLTGTPIPNSMLDIFGQFKILDSSIFGLNFFEFRARYFFDKNAGMPSHVHFPDWQPRPKSAEMIGEIIARHSSQAKKSELKDLPPLIDVEVPVPMSAEQARIYKSMEQEFIAELGGEFSVAEFSMTKTMRLRQILAGFLQTEESDEPKALDSPKLSALRETLESIGGQKTIIWTEFRATYPRIEKICQELKLEARFLTGDQSAKEKEESIEAFCRGSADVLIANAAAGGAGINIQEAPFSIYYDKGYNAVSFDQSRGRNHRAGSQIHSKITHFHLISPGTLDEIISSALIRKQNLQEEVLAWALDFSKKKSDKSYKEKT